jgi:predicted HicB family RNase H-like nuclease
MELKTLRIDKNTHTRLKIFCAINGFQINEWTDVIINQTLDKLKKKNAKKINN